MKKNIFIFAIALITLSCQDELKQEVGTEKFNETHENEYALSIDEALANLKSFMNGMENPLTKSTDTRTVSSVKTVRYNSITTKTSKDNLNCDNLLYIANFENGQGYAILSGDSRIEEDVIAIVDDGEVSDNTIYTAIELANEERTLFEGYPLSGPGFFTTPETGDEVFMNPNTVVLYDDDVKDTLVGNFSLDEEDNDCISNAELLTSYLCISYAINEVRNYEVATTSMTGEDVPDYNGPEEQPPFDGGPHGGGGGPSGIWTEEITSPWVTIDEVNPLLTDYVKWPQDSPFNDLYPERRKIILFGAKRKAPAGCFPLAIAKIMAYFEYPDTYTFNGYTIDWNELNNDFSSLIGSQSAAHLLRSISHGCDCLYFYQGTFTFPSNATSYMRRIGFNNTHSYDYSFNRVTTALKNECPLIIYSIPGINILNSHSWNIDGYKIKERSIITNTYDGKELISTSSRTETSNMVHCDFGWESVCNGYYVSGIFKLDDPNIEHDSNTLYGGDTHYNNLLKVVTYNRPL